MTHLLYQCVRLQLSFFLTSHKCNPTPSPAPGCERELALAVAAGALVSENGLSERVRIVQAHSRSLSVAPPPPPPQQQQPPNEEAAPAAAPAAAAATGNTAAPAPNTAAEAPTAAAAAAAAAAASRQLPVRAGLVVHEIFGTDPLSEHILPSMAQVQVRGLTGSVRMRVCVCACVSVSVCQETKRKAVLTTPDSLPITVCVWVGGCRVLV